MRPIRFAVNIPNCAVLHSRQRDTKKISATCQAAELAARHYKERLKAEPGLIASAREIPAKPVA